MRGRGLFCVCHQSLRASLKPAQFAPVLLSLLSKPVPTSSPWHTHTAFVFNDLCVRQCHELSGEPGVAIHHVNACTAQGIEYKPARYYNEVRVHQNLKGLTPMEAWQGRTLAEVQQMRATQAGQWVIALDGLMVGCHVRC